MSHWALQNLSSPSWCDDCVSTWTEYMTMAIFYLLIDVCYTKRLSALQSELWLDRNYSFLGPLTTLTPQSGCDLCKAVIINSQQCCPTPYLLNATALRYSPRCLIHPFFWVGTGLPTRTISRSWLRARRRVVILISAVHTQRRRPGFGLIPILQVGSLRVWEVRIHNQQQTCQWSIKELVRSSEACLHTPSISEHWGLFVLSRQFLKYGHSLKVTGRKLFKD